MALLYTYEAQIWACHCWLEHNRYLATYKASAFTPIHLQKVYASIPKCAVGPPLPSLTHTHIHQPPPPTHYIHLCTYSDIAIGAPYVDMGSNQGSVYVYYGRADIMEFGQQTPFEVQW